MRIIAGQFKGRRLDRPSWTGLRPTSDKLRETLFNILGAQVVGARVLDGYAGTGALGIEALSRGAAHVTFVDDDRRAVALVAANLQRCGVPPEDDGYAIICANLADACEQLASAPPFQVILLDPPYDEPDLAGVVTLAASRLDTGGLLVLEHARRREAPGAAGRCARMRDVKSGDSSLAFYQCLPCE